MNRSDCIAELAKSLAAAQLEVENAGKNAANPHFRSRYADLAEVLNTVRPVFAKHGLSFVQMPSYAAPNASVETLLLHSSGEFISGNCSMPVSRHDAQGVGSAITYLRRYSLAAMAGISQEDDDAAIRPTAEPQRGDPPAYAQSDFDRNFPAWARAIAGGKKSHEEIIAAVESRAPLTQRQRAVIMAVKTAQEDQQ